MRRWIFVAAALLAVALALWSLRDGARTAPSEEIDEASQEALRDVLEQEDE